MFVTKLLRQKNVFNDVFFLGFAIHVTIQSQVEDFSYFSIPIINCVSIWRKSHNLNDKKVSKIYLIAIIVCVIKFI